MSDWKQDFNKDVKDTRWGVFSVLFKFILPLCLVLGIVGFVWNVASQPAALLEKTVNADNAIYNYEWFKTSYQDIQALDQKIIIAENDLAEFKKSTGARSNMDREDKIEEARLTTIIMGLKNQRESQKAEYNARAQMANRSLFKSNDLPDHLN